jgi:uncharacterized protein with von Willebrand factor type A (vWA) domain
MLPARQTPGQTSAPGRERDALRPRAARGRHAGGQRPGAAALQALQVAGLEKRADFHAVLSACLLDRIEHRELFDQAFDLFWRDPDLEGRMRALLLPKVQG